MKPPGMEGLFYEITRSTGVHGATWFSNYKYLNGD